MSDFGNMFSPIAAKDHRCELCSGPIVKGEKHKHYQGMYEGEWMNYRLHDECFEVLKRDHQFEFTPGEGEMPERVKAGARGEKGEQ